MIKIRKSNRDDSNFSLPKIGLYDKIEIVKIDGKLTTVPFCCFAFDGNIEVLSGNHRVMASIDAGISSIEVML